MRVFERFNLLAPDAPTTKLWAKEIVTLEELEILRQTALEDQPAAEPRTESEGPEMQVGGDPGSSGATSTTTNLNSTTKVRNRKTQKNFDRLRRQRKKDEKGRLLGPLKGVPVALQHSRHLQRGRVVRTQVDAQLELQHTKPAFKGKRVTPTEMKDMKQVGWTDEFEYVSSLPG